MWFWRQADKVNGALAGIEFWTVASDQKISDEERRELIKKMDDDLNDFIEQRRTENKASMSGALPYDKTVDELVTELKRHPAFMTEFDPSQEMSPELEGLQQLKYESDSKYSNADSYKDDGNYNFKKKKYRWAIDNYTKAILEKCNDRELNAILYSNRAAAQYHIGNFRSSFTDCILSRKFKPDHVKAIHRGVLCAIELKRYADATEWCDSGLRKQYERDQRKEAAKARKEKEQQRKLIQTIQDRGIQLAHVKSEISESSDSLIFSSLESHHPSGAKVHLDTNGILRWPMLFVYPEYGQTDLIESFPENTRLSDQIEVMFGAQTEKAPWDKEQKYTPQNIEMYFEEREAGKLHKVDKDSMLQDLLKHKRYVVYGGTPSVIVIVKDSSFGKQFLARYRT
ncbi:hypothetical protein LSH36_266g03024 [Paralvinella palmiformis]|uniref:Cns1/TTC4 wheel domain-containing protein n=1 Tax=Paralvinella palmiformis TaxID=53620 RepID=A0AAD9JKW4_9ANNE|nr:hypothetical protein LSH36_266g03024 [Paralvinella palmiformis]